MRSCITYGVILDWSQLERVVVGVKPLTPGICGCNFKSMLFKLIVLSSILAIQCIVLSRMTGLHWRDVRIVRVMAWKLARVIPVFKNNADVDVMSNYRPISVIGHITKMVEQLVRSQHVNYLEEHSFITPDQSAYLIGHSTQTSLHRVIDDWLENINENQITGLILLVILFCYKKISLYGIKQQELKWFSSYLDRRKQAVLCHNELSSFVNMWRTTGGLFLDYFYFYCSSMICRNSPPMGV